MAWGLFKGGGGLMGWLRHVGKGEGPSLAGLWERTGDRFYGCRVRVTRENSQYQAIITKVPPAMHYFGWNSGEAKWTSIRPISPVLYAAPGPVQDQGQKNRNRPGNLPGSPHRVHHPRHPQGHLPGQRRPGLPQPGLAAADYFPPAAGFGRGMNRFLPPAARFFEKKRGKKLQECP